MDAWRLFREFELYGNIFNVGNGVDKQDMLLEDESQQNISKIYLIRL